ncbi:universal stress protein [Nitrincola alkalilacustris]|uniref:universal stress protein n=1 Tax=Nitrincola alkalilacustris TaxID=1571224 RepID=UPI00124E74B1|nr:universal stress protein [Nitrincola alkalilacustris]
MDTITRLLVNLSDEADHDVLLHKSKILAAMTGSHIELFQCCYNAALSSLNLLKSEARESVQHQQMQRTEAHLDLLAKRLNRSGIATDTDVTWSRHQAEGVITKVERYAPDLVLHQLAQHPYLLHYLLAPQDWQILRECPLPLLLTKDNPWPEHLRIAAAIDPFHLHDEEGSLDNQILDTAEMLATLLGGELHVVHAFNVLPQSAIIEEGGVADYRGLQEKVSERHKDRLHQIITEFDPDLEPSCIHLLEGETHKVLPRFAEEERIDIMVMGFFARGFIDRLLIGSSVERMLDSLPCDIMVVKKPVS